MEGMVRAMELASSSKEVVEVITLSALTKIKEPTIDLKAIYARLFLISDILFNS